MPINFKTLLAIRPCWMQSHPSGRDIVLSTSVRMVRNLPGHRFPGWSTADDRTAVAQKLLPVLRHFPRFRNCYRAEMTELNREDRLILLERKQLTPCMAARQDGCHLLISRDQRLLAMVNEEEHLCLRIDSPGLDIDAMMDDLMDICQYLDGNLDFAFDSENGYRVSVPQEAGEGLQVFATLHLPALAISGQMDRVCRAAEALHLCLSPFCFENGDCGNLYILASGAIPYEEVIPVVEHFADFCELLIRKEERMGDFLFACCDDMDPIDLVYRSYGVLRCAHSLDYQELLGALSLCRFGLPKMLFLHQDRTTVMPLLTVPDSLMKLYTLSPMALRRLYKGINSSRDARQTRSAEVRQAFSSIITLI